MGKVLSHISRCNFPGIKEEKPAVNSLDSGSLTCLFLPEKYGSPATVLDGGSRFIRVCRIFARKTRTFFNRW